MSWRDNLNFSEGLIVYYKRFSLDIDTFRWHRFPRAYQGMLWKNEQVAEENGKNKKRLDFHNIRFSGFEYLSYTI